MNYLKKLYIIGNGFDLHHDIHSSYKCYRKYLSDLGLCGEILDYFSENDPFWNDIEAGLQIDCKEYINNYLEAYNFIQTPPGIVTNQDQKALNKVKSQTSLYKSFLGFTAINFYEWLNKTYFEEIDKIEIDKKLFNFFDDNWFINFNYTSTLQDLYKIDARRILHIHGELRKVNHSDLYVPHTIREDMVIERREAYARNEIQFGNIYNKPIKIQEAIDLTKIKLQNEYISLDDLQKKLESYLRHSYKNIENNFGVLSEFLDSCGEIDQIIVMGNYSLGMDLPYYEKILIPKYKFKKWLIYCHGDKDKEIAEKFRGKYNLNIGTTQW